MAQTKCKRCGNEEFRINGFCSVYCDDMWDVEEEVMHLRGVLMRAIAHITNEPTYDAAQKALDETSNYRNSHAAHAED